MSPRAIELSVVVPCYNEEAVLARCHAEIVSALSKAGISFEIIYINDGSTDATGRLIREIGATDARARYIELSRNFGQTAAIAAGLDFAVGQAAAVIDADLQDPPELLVSMLELWRQGYDVVYGRRVGREGENFFKTTSWRARVMSG